MFNQNIYGIQTTNNEEPIQWIDEMNYVLGNRHLRMGQGLEAKRAATRSLGVEDTNRLVALSFDGMLSESMLPSMPRSFQTKALSFIDPNRLVSVQVGFEGIGVYPADAFLGYAAHGFILDPVVAGETVTVYTDGLLYQEGLPDDIIYYLGQDGMAVATPSFGAMIFQSVGVWFGPDTFRVRFDAPYQILGGM